MFRIIAICLLFFSCKNNEAGGDVYSELADQLCACVKENKSKVDHTEDPCESEVTIRFANEMRQQGIDPQSAEASEQYRKNIIGKVWTDCPEFRNQVMQFLKDSANIKKRN